MTDNIFSLPANLAIDDCDALQQTLSALVADVDLDNVVMLNAHAVERLTTPGLQLLCALEKTLTALHVRLRVCGGSAAFSIACTDLGFKTSYQRWSETTC